MLFYLGKLLESVGKPRLKQLQIAFFLAELVIEKVVDPILASLALLPGTNLEGVLSRFMVNECGMQYLVSFWMILY